MAREMKDSGIAWIGIIPETWDIIKFKYVFSIIGGNGFPDSLQGNTQGDYPFCKVSDINGQSEYVKTATNWVTQEIVDINKFNIIPPNSILMAKIGAALAKNHRKINVLKCCIDNNTQALVLKRNDSIRYLFYLSKCLDMSWFDNNSTVPSINNNRLLNFFIPNISYNEQEKISSYLDIQCTRIDAVMEQTRASIEEYKKLKQAVITQAVTKGIRPNRQMKDSGVDWIGEIPVDWDLLRKLSYACNKNISYGIVKLFDPDDEHGVKVLRCSDIREGIIDTSNIRTVTQDISNEYSRTILDGGEVLINIRGTLGGCAVVPKEMKGYNIAREVAMVSTNNTLNNRFLMYYFLSDTFLTYEEMNLAGSVYIGLNIELLSACPILLPSIFEQIEIANYLDSKCSEINALIAKKECFIQELEKYKKSIIFEYVTGKKGV